MIRHKFVMAATLLGAALAVGCGSEQQPKSAGGQAKEQAAQTAPSPAAYPIDWCIVSGEKLGQMGEPVVYTYQGRTVKFCCKNCIKDFEKTPATYLARLDSAAAGLLKQPSHEPGQGG